MATDGLGRSVGASSPSWPTGIFGPGSDGAVDLDGVNTYASFFSKSGNVYTMTRNVWATDVTVRAGCTLVAHYELSVNGTLTIEATGVLRDNGNDATGSSGAASLTTSRLPIMLNTNGGASGRASTGTGSGPSTLSNAYGGAGGAGGAAGGQAGGISAAANAPAAGVNQLRDGLGYAFTGLLPATSTSVTAVNGGNGGSGGGANVGTGTAASGGGGSGAPIRTLFAKTIANAGEIQCKGGNGGNASVTGNGAAGGGGGGGGGYLLIVSNTPQANAGTISVAGGTGGTGAGGGANGLDGSAGTIDYRAP